MAYGIIRVRNLHMGDLHKTDLHNERKYEESELDLPNVDRTRTYLNFSNSYTDQLNIYDAVNEKLEGVKIRKDSVVALEYVCTLSPEVMLELGNTTSLSTVLAELEGFVMDRHQEGDLINVSYHFDESNPHIHAIVVPITEKEVKWKNRNGEGVKKERRLCARDYTGNKELLRQLQTDYCNYLNSDNHYLATKIKTQGLSIERGIDARERRAKGKYYSRMTNYIIADKINELKQLAEYVKNGDLSIVNYTKEHDKISNAIQSITDNIEKKKEKDSLGKDEEVKKYKEKGTDMGFSF